MMRKFDIVQKIAGGYVVMPRMPYWPSGNRLKFKSVFLKTNKELTPNLIISGVLAYTGEIKFKLANGFDQKIPAFKIPAGLQILGIQKGDDPFLETEY